MNMEKGRMRFALIFLTMTMNPLPLVMSRNFNGFAAQKNYYPPDPHARSSPGDSHKQPDCPTPSAGGAGSTPSQGGGTHGAPTSPSHGGGGYYNTPPTAIPTTPSPLVPLVPPSPTTPSPLTPLVPPSPSTSIFTPPSPPLIPDPNSRPFFPGTCYYWFTHPMAIFVLFGCWPGTLGQTFGMPATFPFGRNMSLLEALGNTHTDGFGTLFREGTASLLNSMADRRFAFTTQQVKNSFNIAVGSEKAAAIQARIFQRANEGHLKH